MRIRHSDAALLAGLSSIAAVEDGGQCLAVGEQGIHGMAEIQFERPAGTRNRVRCDGDSNRLGGLTGGKGERAGGRRVFASGDCGAVGGRVIDRHHLAAGGGEADGEHRRLTFDHRDVADGLGDLSATPLATLVLLKVTDTG